MSEPEITVLVVTYCARELLPRCLDSLAAQTQPHRLLVIDNASTDGTAEYLADRLPAEQRLRLDRNGGFAGGVAAGLAKISTRFVALLNDDAAADPDWLKNLYQQALSDADQHIAAWTSVLVQTDDPATVQNAGVGLLPTGYGVDLLAGAPTNIVTDAEVFGFSGGAALLRTDAVRAVGGFPAEYFLYYEDTDTSWRLRAAGWKVLRVKASVARHDHSVSADQNSALFHFHNERNRLWTMLRNAPAASVASALVRFALTTGSIAAKRLLRRPVGDAANFRVRLRLKVLAATAFGLPRLLADRWSIGRRSTVDRSDLWHQWASPADR